MELSPLGDIVVIRRSSPEEVSAGGIHLVFDADYREDIGVVVSIGPGRLHKCSKCKTSERISPAIKVGDTVLFSTNGHQISKVNGEELIVLREPSIIAVIEGDTNGVSSGTRAADRKYAGYE